MRFIEGSVDKESKIGLYSNLCVYFASRLSLSYPSPQNVFRSWGSRMHRVRHRFEPCLNVRSLWPPIVHIGGALRELYTFSP